MADSRFFKNAGPLPLEQIVALTGAVIGADTSTNASARGLMLADVAPLDRAGNDCLSFFDNPKYIEQFRHSSARACFVKEKYAGDAPAGMVTLITEEPYRAYALAAQQFYPRKAPEAFISDRAVIDSSAQIAKGCRIEAGAVISAGVSIGEGSVIGANSVIESGVQIGTKTQIGACCTISHALIGDRVIIHRGVNIGQDGFGFALGRAGHIKVPQLGRVMIEDDVEIGSGTCIDRGTGPDTHIGIGAKIDNLVQIGHNVQIGQGAVIVAQVGIAGSSRIGDGAVLAGQVGIAGHLRIGAGARLAAQAGVMEDVPAGAAYGGSPAVPVKQWHRQTVALTKLSRKTPRNKGETSDE